MSQELLRFVLFAGVSTAVAGIWLERMSSERPAEERWSRTSIVAITRGDARSPFVQRRLFFDLAAIVSKAVPQSVWNGVETLLKETKGGARLRSTEPMVHWPADEVPLLMSATLLTWISALGFLYSCLQLIRALYVAPRWLADLSASAVTFGILGAIWDQHYGLYPYDIPHACIFTWAGYLAIQQRKAFYAVFLAAAYSKETAILLVPIWFFSRSKRWSIQTVLTVGVLVASFVVIRSAISHAFPGSGENWYALPRNLKMLTRTFVFDSWVVTCVLLALLGLARTWRTYPDPLKVWLMLLPVSLSLALWQGWVEERRAYLEFLAPAGLLAIQSLTAGVGLGWLLRSRTVNTGAYTEYEIGTTVLKWTPSLISSWLDRLYPSQTGFAGILLRWRPYICPLHEVLCRIPPCERLLDVGCGGGMLANLAVASKRAQFALGFDTAAGPIRVAQSAVLPPGSGRTEFRQLAATDWPDGQFDVVVSIDVVHHVPRAHQAAFVERLCQSVTPGGRLIFKDMSPHPRWRAVANSLHDLLMAREWVHYADPLWLKQQVASHGLVIRETGDWNILWYAHYYLVAERPADVPATQS